MTSLLIVIYLVLCAVLLQLLRWEFARMRAERRPSLKAMRYWARTGIMLGEREDSPSRAKRTSTQEQKGTTRGCPASFHAIL